MQCSIPVVGLDGSGKSTLINHTKPSAQQRPGELVPTVGCSVEEIKRGNLHLTVFDMAGGSNYRNMWANHFAEADGVVYVIDSADVMRM
jgi:ADP-ribosylation factor-like protein 6